MKRYTHFCPLHGEYESPTRPAPCPLCGKLGRRVFDSKPLRTWKGSSKEAS